MRKGLVPPPSSLRYNPKRHFLLPKSLARCVSHSGAALLLQPKKSASLARKGAILLLALAVFGLGLGARLALYRSHASALVTSVKLSTEKQSAVTLRSTEVGSDDSQSLARIAFALLYGSLSDAPSSALSATGSPVSHSNPTRFQLSCVTSLRRPPPTSYL